MDGSPFPAAMFLIPVLLWLGMLVFIIAMAVRLVRGVERIAAALERK
jgi:hypothetical protein